MQESLVCMAGLNPPSSSNDDEVGRRLMALVRASEKSTTTSTTVELREFLTELVSLYSRKGLLQGNVTKAQKVLESSTSSTTKTRGGGRRTQQHSASVSDDESLLFSALIRILTLKEEEETSSFSMIALAANVCRAIAMYIQNDCIAPQVLRAEQEILVQSSRSLLTSMASTIENLVFLLSSRTGQQTLALQSCLQATTSLLSVLGAVKVPPTLGQAAWTALIDANDKVQASSALLLSILPLTDKNTAEAWSVGVSDAVVALGQVLKAMAPLRQQTKTPKTMISQDTQAKVTDWINQITKVESEEERFQVLRSYIRGLTAYLVALLTRRAYATNTTTRAAMMTAKLDIESLLHLFNCMIQFPAAAETTFFSTKKRLRMEVVQNGLLSPAALVLEMANVVKYLGHDIMDTMLCATAGGSLLPFARRVVRIAQSSLLASASTALQKVLDPTMLRVDGNRKQWLQNSLVLRARAIQTYGMAIKTLGASVLAKSLSNHDVGGNNTRDDTIAVSAIGGCLLEQLSWPEEANDDWASLSERVDLCVAALNALTTVLTIGGGYLPLSCRSMIDSIVLTCFASVSVKSKSRVANWPLVKVEMLKLGSVCLCTPWPDGAMSSIMSELRQMAGTCTHDCNGDVAAEAAACLRLCDSLSIPRAPALSIVTSREHGREAQTAVSLLENLKSAREDIVVCQAVADKKSHPLVSSLEKVEVAAKRQKLEVSDGAEKPAQDPSKSSVKPSPAKQATHVVDKLQSESMQEEIAQPEAKVVELTRVDALPSKSERDAGSVTHVSDGVLVAEAKAHSVEKKDENSVKPPKRRMETASLKKDPNDDDDSDDDDFLPDIVVDGGPDEEDQ